MSEPLLLPALGARRARIVTLMVAALAPACGPGEVLDEGPADVVPPAVDLTTQLFRPDHVLEIEITLAAGDWAELRQQSRSVWDILGNSCLSPPVSPFTYFPGDVRIDGELVETIGVRKKGFFGSLDNVRPSLKLKLDEYVDGQRLFGSDNLTLNNNKSDPSNVKQCLGYRVFAAAGLPAPRCGFAHVTVNGEDLGVYTHVEAIKKAFLARHFADARGNLYEGALSDFRPGWVDTFQRKTNELDGDRSDIEALVPVLELPDAELEAALADHVDLDHFATFWAAEFLVGHLDGYARNTNNFYLYSDPATGKLWFIPWGIDSILSSYDGTLPWEEQTPPWLVWAEGVLARRLYLHDPARYFGALDVVLGVAWDEVALLAELERLAAMLTPYVGAAAESGNQAALQAVRDFIAGRRAAIEAHRVGSPPVWPLPLRDPWCVDVLGAISGEFATTWGTLGMADPFSQGSATLSLTIGAVPEPVPDAVTALAGLDASTGEHVLQVAAFRDPDTIDIAHMVINPALLVPGTSQTFDWVKLSGYALRIVFPPPDCVPPPGETECPPTVTLLGAIGDGVLELSQASTNPGAPVIGTLSAVLYEVWF